ncbi:lipoyl(octanoyl) transferase [Sphingomonas vulcanisoli]|uniref:Octanoyltransferase n=1 Tax=Sphingomonas vulcanisoli TaxID=1658060 RepID=A0ABX0TSB3_9SPHN|nr:lipoyl(octanoyl) transferase LipB [Sphingomonas vulcanisoli]NIJ08387.1 lipoyl(octanoyl) transferase [Sphingomonas vulcanisoli]
MASAPDMSTVEWRVSPGLTDYEAAVAAMEARAAAIREGTAPELIWLVEHPPLITAGTSAPPEELIAPDLFPVFKSGRGGRHTYHGPGQRVGYVLLDLEQRGRDVRRFVEALEGWLIATLGRIGIAARTAEGRIGIWVDDLDGQEAKIGAIGIRVRRWVTFHGFAINIAPALHHFGAIVPCGLPDFPVASVESLGLKADIGRFDAALTAEFPHFLSSLAASAVDS